MINILAPIFALIALAYANSISSGPTLTSSSTASWRASRCRRCLTVTTGWIEIPAAADRVVKLLAGSAGPCALVAHGLFLARDDPSNARPWAAALRPRPLALVTLKLLAQPVVTALLAVCVFYLKGMNAQIVVILSALTTGTGAFMLADVYKRDLEVTSTTILVSTVASAVTLSICLVLLPRLL